MSGHDDAELRVIELKEQLRQYDEAMARWASTVNEINNMLAAMKGHAQLVEMQPSEDKIRELVKVVLSTISRVQELVRTSVQESEMEAEQEEFRGRLVDPSQISILVVDDEVLIRSLLYELLVKSGYTVQMAGSGADAVQECKDHIFDLILMDFRLGDMTGVQALRQIREYQKECRVVFLTGDPSIEEIQATVLKEGADGFITKPFDLKEINDVVQHLMHTRTA